jgi:methanogenic corrinoid protein MtbC1
MSGFRSLAYFDDWPSSNGGFEVLRPPMEPRESRFSRASRAKLATVVEQGVIPQLLLSHTAPRHAPSSKDSGVVARTQDVASFSRHMVTGDIRAAQRIVTRLRAAGASVASIHLDLFTRSARHLGDLWIEDVCDFADVTLGLSRMQQMMRTLSPDFLGEVRPSFGSRRAVLMAAPGDDHDFGIQIVREFFRRDGWDVAPAATSYDGLLREVQTLRCAVVGISVTKDASVDGLATIIRAVRRNAVDPSVKVMVGGRFFLEHPHFVDHVGADATATDGRGAVTQISSLLDTSALQC